MVAFSRAAAIARGSALASAASTAARIGASCVRSLGATTLTLARPWAATVRSGAGVWACAVDAQSTQIAAEATRQRRRDRLM